MELEVKSKLNQIQRNENNKKKKDELERLRLQQEVLNQFVRKGEQEEYAYKTLKKQQERAIADYNMNSPRFHGQKKPEEDEAEREY